MAASAALIAPASGVAPEPVATCRFNTEKYDYYICGRPYKRASENQPRLPTRLGNLTNEGTCALAGI
jgi:hypothetical protein